MINRVTDIVIQSLHKKPVFSLLKARVGDELVKNFITHLFGKNNLKLMLCPQVFDY